MNEQQKQVCLIGIGTGVYEGMTLQAAACMEACDVLFGAERMLAVAKGKNARLVALYQAPDIAAWLAAHTDWVCAGVLLSGDVGFYSGAKKLAARLFDYELTLIPGVSSLAAFFAKLQLPWEEAALASMHGRSANLIAKICRNTYTFALFGSAQGLYGLCEKLIYYGMDDVELFVGENIGYENERICRGTAREICAQQFDRLLVAVAHNYAPMREQCPVLPDEAFVRADVPMTKCEVRTLAVQKLGLGAGSVLYDVGAGTGSVSVQAAVGYPDCAVYAIEHNGAAIPLIEANRRKFRADNLSIVHGKAPDALAALPAPTHVFIGGSSGSLRDILRAVWAKNNAAVVVLTVISLDTLAQAVGILRDMNITDEEIIQLYVARGKKAGSHHLMMGQNPVTLMKIKSAPEQEEKK